MKSLAELNEIRNRVKQELSARETAGDADIRVVIGMATCGIAAGARPVLAAFSHEVATRKLSNVKVSQTGCIGLCKLEPIVEVFRPGEPKVTYIKVTADKVAKIVSEHLVNGRAIREYMLQENV